MADRMHPVSQRGGGARRRKRLTHQNSKDIATIAQISEEKESITQISRWMR